MKVNTGRPEKGRYVLYKCDKPDSCYFVKPCELKVYEWSRDGEYFDHFTVTPILAMVCINASPQDKRVLHPENLRDFKEVKEVGFE
jgi:hypothetical protein